MWEEERYRWHQLSTPSGCDDTAAALDGKTSDDVNRTPTNTARTELHSMITFHHANTHGSRAGRLRIAHPSVLKQLSSTCHVSFLA